MQVKPIWEEIPEFSKLAQQLIEKRPDLFEGADVNLLVAYGCVNKQRPEKKKKFYDMSGETEPEAFTNSKKYFVKFFMEDWEGMCDTLKIAHVAEVLDRIDWPTPGKIAPYDYKDHQRFINVFGANWWTNPNIPNLLTDDVNFGAS